MSHFLYIWVTSDVSTKVRTLDHPAYMLQILQRFQIEGATEVSGSLDSGMYLLRRNRKITSLDAEARSIKK